MWTSTTCSMYPWSHLLPLGLILILSNLLLSCWQGIQIALSFHLMMSTYSTYSSNKNYEVHSPKSDWHTIDLEFIKFQLLRILTLVPYMLCELSRQGCCYPAVMTTCKPKHVNNMIRSHTSLFTDYKEFTFHLPWTYARDLAHCATDELFSEID